MHARADLWGPPVGIPFGSAHAPLSARSPRPVPLQQLSAPVVVPLPQLPNTGRSDHSVQRDAEDYADGRQVARGPKTSAPAAVGRDALMAQLGAKLGRCNTPQLRQLLRATEDLVTTSNQTSVPAQTSARPQGRKRALSIAINYLGQRGELRGCINDQQTICSLWTSLLGLQPDEIVALRDDDKRRMPTKSNMIQAMQWLVQGARPGDRLFFHYSGHGGQTRDAGGDERDGKDETLIPVDYQRAGTIRDDELRALLVLPLPEGVQLLGLLDCCHSGTGMDLPFVVKMQGDGQAVSVSRKPKKLISGNAKGEVVMLSGCKDSQTSADAQIGSKYAGAMTSAFHHTVKGNPHVSMHGLLAGMRKYLLQGRYTQVPQMSAEHLPKLDEEFFFGPGLAIQVPLSMSGSNQSQPPRRKALSIAINYIGQRGELRGCLNDQDTIRKIWRKHFGLHSNEIQTLRDDDQSAMPTKRNILEALRWLVNDVQPGDRLFFHYSGHGGQTKDTSGDEKDNQDETLIPVDYHRAGMISDDELREILVLPMCEGATLFGLMDCCHSGTGMDLPFVVKMGADGHSVTISKKPGHLIRGSGKIAGDVIMLSGCKDTQTSADAFIGSRYAGAMTTALHDAVSKRPGASLHKVLRHMRRYLQKGGYTQVPQLSSENMLKLDVPFISK